MYGLLGQENMYIVWDITIYKSGIWGSKKEKSL